MTEANRRPGATRIVPATTGPSARARCAVTALLSSLAAAGCGGTGPEPRSGTTSGSESYELRGLRVVQLPRATAGRTELALWIAAGSRDAEPPQLATVAAWLAAEQAGRDVRAHVLPDGTELSLTCDTQQLRQCSARLMSALELREVAGDRLAAAVRRLQTRRRRALTDEGRTADGLALQALLGDPARLLAPLGEARDDEAVTPGRLTRFLQSHYGTSRALLAAAGDASAESFRGAVAEAVESSPQVGGRRPERTPPLATQQAEHARVVAQLGRRAQVTAAAATERLEDAAALAKALTAPDGPLRVRMAMRGAELEPVAYAFELRGGALVLARVAPPGDLAAAGGELAYELARLQRELPAAPDLDPTRLPGPARAAVRTLGRRWVAQGRRQPFDAAVGVGAVIPQGRAEGARDAERQRQQLSQSRARLQRAIDSAVQHARPQLRGDATERVARGVLDNGARITAERRGDDARVAVAIRLAGGTGDDPATQHGRAALLATLMTTACAGRPTEALRAELHRMDARMRPIVAPDALGLVLDAPHEHWQRAIDLAWRCAAAPRLQRDSVERARLELLERLTATPAHHAAAWAAAAVAPSRPGMVAPLGSPRTLPNIREGDLRRAHARHAVGARLSAAFVGDVPTREATQWLARRAARWDAGTRPAPPGRPARVAGEDSTQPWEGPLDRVVVAWSEQGAARRVELERFARATAKVLERVRGLRVAATAAGGHGGQVWAAVALEVQEQEVALGSLASLVRSAVAEADPASVPVPDARRGRQASAAARARSLSARAFGRRERSDEPKRIWNRLARSEPRFVIGHARTR